MQDTRKREIRIKADSFRANCKIGRYGIIDLFKECERMDYILLRYPFGENADLGFMTKRDNDIHRFIDYVIYNYNHNAVPKETLERVLACYGLSIDDVSDKIITPSVDDDDLDDLKLKEIQVK